MNIGKLLSVTMASFLTLASGGIAHAQTYPTKPIRLLIGFGPGGATDVIGRYYAQRMSEALKTTVLVDNRPSAGQLVAIRTMVSAQPDGYTLFLGTGSSFSQGPGVRKDLPFDPLRDFTLIGLTSKAAGVMMISPNSPARSVREFIAHAKENPNRLNFGSSGVGAASHLQMEYFLNLTRLTMTHVPYKSAADINREIITGAVHVGIVPLESAISGLGTGRLRALAVTGTRRVKSLPDVPSLGESGVPGLEGIDPYTYYGLAGPAGLPKAIVFALSNAINRVADNPEHAAYVRERLYNEPGVSSPEAFRSYIADDIAKWRELGKSIKLGS